MKIWGAILCAVSACVTVVSIVALFHGDIALAGLMLLAGIIGMAAMLLIIWWRAIAAHDEMMKR